MGPIEGLSCASLVLLKRPWREMNGTHIDRRGLWGYLSAFEEAFKTLREIDRAYTVVFYIGLAWCF